jgi:cellulose synthase/poly-beta-1,6-N-acetylglucosamine synthase-like glycosyltransferase
MIEINTLSTIDYMKIIIAGFSFIDFMIFCIFFIYVMSFITRNSNTKTTKTLLSTKILGTSIIFLFIIFKILHIPIFMSFIPITYKIPGSSIIIIILTILNIILAILPLTISTINIVLSKKPSNSILLQHSNKYVNIIMPIYNENPHALLKTIQSIINLNYPKHLMHLYLSFDEGIPENDQFNSEGCIELMKYYHIDISNTNYRIDLNDSGLPISFCRFTHGGKKSTQASAFREIEKNNLHLADSLIFFIDSDVILHKDSLSQFTFHMENYNKSGLTGLITCINSEKPNLLSFYQDAEYISSQILWKNFETYLGSTSCLPGAFTILKYSFLKKVSSVYFNSNTYIDCGDYNRFYLGEDRYLTHLLMEIEPRQLGFCKLAKCKTYAPKTISELLKQRRRWYLGHLFNEIWIISSIKLWKYYPLFSLCNLLNNIRNSSLYIYLLYFVIVTNLIIYDIYYLFIFIIPLIIMYIFMILYSFGIQRLRVSLSYLLILVFQPLFSMLFMYYSIYTINQTGWGGIRDKKVKNSPDSIITINSDK